ncbi:hypothetical protein FKM82_027307 [Ascaphus truei]
MWENDIQRSKKLETYHSLQREYTLAPYLLKVNNPKQRQTMGQYRMSAHSLEIETGRHRQNWKPREMRLCQRCELGEVCERHRQI